MNGLTVKRKTTLRDEIPSNELMDHRRFLEEAVKRVATDECVPPEQVWEGIKDGTIVILANPLHKGVIPVGIGKGLRTKVNANIGTSVTNVDINREIEKLHAALSAGADTVMDLSTGGTTNDIDQMRQRVLEHCTAPLGTVPIYQAAVMAIEQRGSIVEMTSEDIFDTIEKHAADGVDFMTVHCGITRDSLTRLMREGRVTSIVSRGGAFIAAWMIHNDAENPLYSEYDRLLEIASRYGVTLSLGDALRPGSIADATDRAQVQETIVLGELIDRAREAEVQVMVEGPGHVPLNQIAANVILQKRLCHNAPFYVLGPLVTDVAAGYDHIAAAIGGAIAAASGADFLCYVTPTEHLGLPDLEAVREGVIAARIAGHAADVAKGISGAMEWDRRMSEARKSLDWSEQIRLSIDPERAKRLRSTLTPAEVNECSMCGRYCAMKIVSEYLNVPVEKC